MDEISNKAISIGVAVFITIAIASGIFYVINQMKNIYEQVYETNISIQSSFSEFEAYDNTEKTGIDIINVIKKYKDNPKVKIYVDNVEGINLRLYKDYVNYVKNEQENQLKNYLNNVGTKKYISNVILDEPTGITTIKFSSK